MNGNENDVIVSIVKKLFQNKSLQEKASLLVGIINDLFNMHPVERDGSFYSEEWSKQIFKLVRALGFLIKQNSDKNQELLDYENKLTEVEAQHNDLLKKLEKNKVDLEYSTKKLEDIIDKNRTLEENLRLCRAIEKLSVTIQDLPFIKERTKECSFVAAIDTDIENILMDATVLYGEIKEKLDQLEACIRDYVISSEEEMKSLKKEIGR
jgi:hypothetical protein